MTLSEFIKKDLNPNIAHTAFFLGNGMNNFCATTSSWKELLIDLAVNHIDEKGDYEKILSDNTVSYPEFFDLIQLSSNVRDETFDYKSIKKGIRNGFEKWKPQKIHEIWTEKLIELNRPVLTTNYDYLLEFSNLSIRSYVRKTQYNKRLFRPQRIKNKDGKVGFSPYYPWHSYYSNRTVENANSEFAIWHIHGFYEYASSIRLGLTDYMGIVEKGRRWLLKSTGNPFNKRSELKKWVGNNSWLDVFLNNHLVFIGIDLGVQETSLRWLLIEREKLFKQYPETRKKTWFIRNLQYDKMKQGKRLFFEKLNIEIIDAKDAKQIFETMPKKIKRKGNS
jgi:hypothetical protein